MLHVAPPISKHALFPATTGRQKKARSKLSGPQLNCSFISHLNKRLVAAAGWIARDIGEGAWAGHVGTPWSCHRSPCTVPFFSSLCLRAVVDNKGHGCSLLSPGSHEPPRSWCLRFAYG